MTPEISFTNHMSNGTKIQLETKCSYNVKYANEPACRGEISINVTDKEAPDKFAINVKMVGFFSYEDGADKDLLHIETFRMLFPYARALISTITANAGIPAVIIPDINIEGQNIYRFGNQ